MKNMRSLLLLLAGAATAFSQPFSIGVKGGLPLTDFMNSVNSQHFNFASNTNRYIIGLDAELHLPFGLGVEFDALYRHFSYTGTSSLVDVLTNTRTTGNDWEFPLLAKYRFPTRVVRPYVGAGIAWSTLQGLSQSFDNVVSGRPVTGSTSHPAELNKSTTTGFVVGAGLDIHALIVHVTPEVRYTRWGAQHFLDTNGGFHSDRNQAEFLVGVTF
jgi:opacity protein-like surface antigen